MAGPFWLPEDAGEGDFVEIGMLGPTASHVDPLQRLRRRRDRRVGDAPMLSLYGLAPAPWRRRGRKALMS